MRKLVPMLASASAAALTTLTVTVAVPAIADDAGSTKDRDAFVSCLHAHGLDGAPAGAALKPWLGERMAHGDAASKRALKACSPETATVLPGPSAEKLRSCLAGHGVSLPGGDGLALKRWLIVHADDAASSAAMRACGIAPEAKLAAGACGKPAGGSAFGVEPAKRGEGDQGAGKLGGGEPRN
jgi:hypothetical protein